MKGPESPGGYDIYGVQNPLVRIVTYAILSILMLPIVVVVITSFSPGNYVTFQFQELSVAPYRYLFQDIRWRQALWMSIHVGVLTTVISLLLSIPAAWAVSRRKFRLKEVFSLLSLGPFIVPPIILGIGLLAIFMRLGLSGSYWGLVIGHTLVGTPVAFLVLRSVLVSVDPALEDAATSLGAGSLRVFAEITLPLILPGLLAAGLFVFLTSFTEYTISVFLSGPRTLTLPVRVWTALRDELHPAISAVSTIMILVSVSLVFLGTKYAGLKRVSGSR
jgi:ABC-type spermidine/putrescine transport system permease subunit II